MDAYECVCVFLVIRVMCSIYVVCRSVLQCVAACVVLVIRAICSIYDRFPWCILLPPMPSKCVAVCCNVWQCVTVCCSVLQCVAVCCNVLQCVATWRIVLQCVAECLSVLQYSTENSTPPMPSKTEKLDFPVSCSTNSNGNVGPTWICIDESKLFEWYRGWMHFQKNASTHRWK
jgi:hypothetical protein